MDFIIAGVAAVGAGFFTNPLEVLKTRMQLQGELHAKGQYTVHYRNIIHASYTIAKHEGFLSLQKGLSPALWVQFILNGVRLGIYQSLEDRGLILNSEGGTVFYKSVLAGGVGGVAGQIACSPVFLVKTHLQTQGSENIAVGFQHKHRGMVEGLRIIFEEQGIKGLFRGAGASIPRAFVGSTSQLTSFKYSKEFLNQYDYFSDKPLLTSFCGSMVGGVAISVMMTPFDLIMTRLYNQPVDPQGKGLLYANYFDCVIKIFKTEGVSAFYKGVGPMYLRLGPHTVLCLVFWDELKRLYDKFLQ
ncbi:solute carrier family 25 member 35 isoform X2 [Tribolium castaneum]|uniref:solute carrier family 25 member 35 isoform X2 n=1 Tax=Tribolium castaneum TaxID=7070 RepID=UPI0000D571E9|nr:PREDICTED: solute carrier family 25 member 35 isoform X2 [Tribolium castaneum]|eukprot:XP_972193.1 PREDICTED: solute carrier family 25 member 35 isoform X2 [Tribolium castaneum]